MRKMLVAVSLSFAVVAPSMGAESIYSEQDKLIRSGQAVGTLGADLFGDKVNLYNGTLDFTQTDVSLPGNNALSVSIGRRLVPGLVVRTDGLFSDWDLDIPHLHGVFSAAPQGLSAPWTSQNGGRCTAFGAPPVVNSQGGGMWNPDEYWHGSFMYIPGAGSQEILTRAGTGNNNVPTDGNTWPLVTRASWALRCLPAPIARGAGEGFLAISPDGTQYRFDWLVSRAYQAISKPGPFPEGLVSGPQGTNGVRVGVSSNMVSAQPGITSNLVMGYGLTRQEVWILPTQVIDRFGNTVTYNYDSTRPWRLNSIVASDGRTITLSYVGTTNHVASVYDGSRIWTYTHGSDIAGSILTGITQPDNSTWQFSMGPFTRSLPMYGGDPGSCDDSGGANTIGETGSMKHPSGATGTFLIRATLHGRSFVARSCRGNPADGDYPTYPRYIGSKSLITKTITGPGLPSLAWNYSYSPAANTASWSTCTGTCVDTKTVDVIDPRNVLTRYTFGTRFQVTEGQLQKTEVGPSGGAFLRTTTNHYRAPDIGPYAPYIGSSPQKRGNGELAGRFTPLDQRVINQQGVTFTWQADATSFDRFARPRTVTRSSSLGSSRTEKTVFADDPDNTGASTVHTIKWVLGQIGSVTEASTNAVMVSNVYDPSTATLSNTSKFGRLDQSFTYYPDGTLWTRKDGLNQTTTFANYMRGLARNATYADGTAESATIENRGLITSVTDANNFTTSYGYDLIGRLNLITRPAGDTVVWNTTSLAFEPVTVDEYGLPAGHWRQTISTGNARTINYFDALFRPRLTRTFDAANEANTAKTVLRNFDADNRKVFESYPARTIGSVNSTPVGASTAFDGLGRPINTFADSELGLLTTTIEYLTNFQKRVTNPRGYATTTSYQVFDEPSESAIATIAAPETLSVGINRDVFGKPTGITRSGTIPWAVSATRSYVYDANQRLCKTVEPEIGATIQNYDAANNVTWRATGLTLTSLVCDRASVPPASKVSFGYDTRNRLASTSFGDGSPGITRTYTPDGLPLTIGDAGYYSSRTYSYNKRRLPTSEVLNFVSGGGWTVSRGYDANGHENQLSYPDGATVSFAPNALGEPTQVGSHASAVNYHPNGAVAGYTLANGIVHTLTQNTRGLPLQNRDAGVMQDLYGFDANGNVTSISDQQEGVSSRSLGYDGLDRLTTANSPGVWGSGSYAYDALDNLRTSIVGSRNSVHNYDAANRLSTINTNGAYTGYVYDTQGNITGRGTQGFYFDQGNRLTLANGVLSSTYDGLGRRVRVGKSNGDASWHFYSQDGQLLYVQRSLGGAGEGVRYAYLQGKLIAEVSTSSGTSYVHTDALGSPVARTNSAGVLPPFTRTRYEPYGNTAAGTVPNGIGFTGHVNDPDTGLVYMQQRYYDPVAARFLSVDPVTTDANTGRSFGRYHYANNNPFGFADPDGREPRGPPPANLSDCTSATGNDCGWGDGSGSSPPTAQAFVPPVATSPQLKPPGVAPATGNGLKIGGAISWISRLLGTVTLPLALTGDTSGERNVFHYTTKAGHEGISKDGYIAPSKDKNVYVTPDLYLTSTEAQSKLALGNTPVGYFVIPWSDIVPAGRPGPVAPANGQPGQGTEIKVPHPVSVKNSIWIGF